MKLTKEEAQKRIEKLKEVISHGQLRSLLQIISLTVHMLLIAVMLMRRGVILILKLKKMQIELLFLILLVVLLKMYVLCAIMMEVLAGKIANLINFLLKNLEV